MDEQEEPNKQNDTKNTDEQLPVKYEKKLITPRKGLTQALKQSCNWHGISIDGVTETQSTYSEIFTKGLPDRSALARKGIDYHLSKILYNVAKDAGDFLSIDTDITDWLQSNVENYRYCNYPPLLSGDQENDRPIIQHAWMLVSLLEDQPITDYPALAQSAEAIEQLLKMDTQLTDAGSKIKQLIPKLKNNQQAWQEMRTAIYKLSGTLNKAVHSQDEPEFNNNLGNTMILEEDRVNDEDEGQLILRLAQENLETLNADFSSLLAWMARTKSTLSPNPPDSHNR